MNSQFTSEVYVNSLEKHRIAISMDGKGRAIDNVFIERLWRSVKYEHMYTCMSRTMEIISGKGSMSILAEWKKSKNMLLFYWNFKLENFSKIRDFFNKKNILLKNFLFLSDNF